MSIWKYIRFSKWHSNFSFPPETILAACYYKTIFLLFKIVTEFIPEDSHRLLTPAQRSARCCSPSRCRAYSGKPGTKSISVVPCLPAASTLSLGPSKPFCPAAAEQTGNTLTEDQHQEAWLKKPFSHSYQRLHSNFIITTYMGKYTAWS